MADNDLTDEVAAPARVAGRSPWDPGVAAGLTPQRLSGLLQEVARGNHDSYITLASEMELRDPHYFAVLQTRKLAVAHLPVVVEPHSNTLLDVKIADEVREILHGEAFQSALLDVLDAVGKGFSVVEIVWERGRNWAPKSFKWRNPRWFKWDEETADRLLLRVGPQSFEELAPHKYIVHLHRVRSGVPVLNGVARQVAAMHLFKSYALRDWMAFAEVFGMPIRIGKYAPGTSDDDIRTLQNAVRDIGSDAAAVLCDTMRIDFERASMSGNAGSDKFFEGLADWCNREISKAVLSQTMTTEDGSSRSQAEVHKEVQDSVVRGDARQVGATIRRDLVRSYVRLNYGDGAPMPNVFLDTSDDEDVAALASVLPPFIDRGLRVTEASILQRLGFDSSFGDSDDRILGQTEDAGEAARAIAASMRMEAKIAELQALAAKSTNMGAFKKKAARIFESE